MIVSDAKSDNPLSSEKNNTLKVFDDSYLEAKARIWPRLSYMCRLRSTAAGERLDPWRFRDRHANAIQRLWLRSSRAENMAAGEILYMIHDFFDCMGVN